LLDCPKLLSFIAVQFVPLFVEKNNPLYTVLA